MRPTPENEVLCIGLEPVKFIFYQVHKIDNNMIIVTISIFCGFEEFLQVELIQVCEHLMQIKCLNPAI